MKKLQWSVAVVLSLNVLVALAALIFLGVLVGAFWVAVGSYQLVQIVTDEVAPS